MKSASSSWRSGIDRSVRASVARHKGSPSAVLGPLEGLNDVHGACGGYRVDDLAELTPASTRRQSAIRSAVPLFDMSSVPGDVRYEGVVIDTFHPSRVALPAASPVIPTGLVSLRKSARHDSQLHREVGPATRKPAVVERHFRTGVWSGGEPQRVTVSAMRGVIRCSHR